ncbi:MAG: glycoside hydrolase family 13 protein [Lachnospiraceae bacterium]|nr:glycoside hydrolase family 13 protein [Lachnospiraceae bacterium]
MSEQNGIILEALYSDGTKDYRNPAEPLKMQMVVLTMRTARDNATAVTLLWNEERLPMTISRSEGRFDYYSVCVNVGSETDYYCFEIRLGEQVLLYDKRGITDYRNNDRDFAIMPGFVTPDWAKGAVIYQIFVDRFYNGDETNDVEDREYAYINKHVNKVTDWNKFPDTDGIREFYGGDIKGVIDKLGYLHELGIEAIYFNPIFVSPSNHKYDIQDYDNVDPHLGKIVNDRDGLLAEDDLDNSHAEKYINRVTSKANLDASNELFLELVQKAHALGIKVIIDGVFNHCGSFHKWMDFERIYDKNPDYEKGAFITKESPYNEYFSFHNGEAWPNNDSFEGWWGHRTLPKLNYEQSEDLVNRVIAIGEKWVSEPYCVDGWRLDVAADLGYSSEFNHSFWQKFYKAVKAKNPDAIILAEHYGDPSAWLKGGEWDSVMNYDAFMEPVTWFLTGMQKHSDEFATHMLGNSDAFFDAMNYHMSRYNTQSLYMAMNELSNHDHSRFLTRTNRMVGRIETMGAEAANKGIHPEVMREAIVIQMTWPGAPTIYYGDEAGVCGWTDPDNRRTYPWGHEDISLLKFYKELIRIHKENEVLRTGSYKKLYGAYNLIAYGRFDKNSSIVVVVNNDENSSRYVEIPVWEVNVPDNAVMERLVLTTKYGVSVDNQEFMVEDGYLRLDMPEVSAYIIKYTLEGE